MTENISDGKNRFTTSKELALLHMGYKIKLTYCKNCASLKKKPFKGCS